MTADVGGLVGLGHHGHGVPADVGADQALHLQVARILGLLVHRDGVEVRRAGDRGNRMPRTTEVLDKFADDQLLLLGRLAGQRQGGEIGERFAVADEIGARAGQVAICAGISVAGCVGSVGGRGGG